MDSVVRVLLHKMGRHQQAYAIVREIKSTYGAVAVAEHAQSSGDHRAAIEFLVLAKKTEEVRTFPCIWRVGKEWAPRRGAEAVRWHPSVTNELACLGWAVPCDGDRRARSGDGERPRGAAGGGLG